MGSVSVWHLVILLVVIALPLFFAFKSAPAGPNRFGEPPQPLGFTQAVAAFFQNYATFSGRASRSAFWYAALFVFLISLACEIIDASGIVSGLWGLAVMIPSFALATRRLHDINRSGWHQLVAFLGPIGAIVAIVWYCTRASDGTAAGTPANVVRAVNMDEISRLERLAKLKESGALTPEEYEAEKRKILG